MFVEYSTNMFVSKKKLSTIFKAYISFKKKQLDHVRNFLGLFSSHSYNPNYLIIPGKTLYLQTQLPPKIVPKITWKGLFQKGKASLATIII